MQIQRILKEAGLCYRDQSQPDLVALGQFLRDPEKSLLQSQIPEKKHTVLFMVNGLNSALLDQLKDDNVLKNHKQCDLYSVVPTTDLNTMISFYTGTYPSEHGILGDYQHLRKENVSYCYTTFLDRINKRDLGIYGLTPQMIYRLPEITPPLSFKAHTLLPNYIKLDPYLKAILKGQSVSHYQSLTEVYKKVGRILKTSFKPTTIVVVITEFESLMKQGDLTPSLIRWLEQFSKTLSELTFKNTNVLVSSFHGAVRPDASIVLNYSKYNKYFYALPSIEHRMTSFYVREEFQPQFMKEFRLDYGGLMALFKTEELIKLGIFGPEQELSQYGEFIATNLDNNYLELPLDEEIYMDSLNHPEFINYISGGMREEEMLVPLIVLTQDE